MEHVLSSLDDHTVPGFPLRRMTVATRSTDTILNLLVSPILTDPAVSIAPAGADHGHDVVDAKVTIFLVIA